ncbi:MAG: HEAT repeat domain-containing protein [Halalkalicoccus sp.]
MELSTLVVWTAIALAVVVSLIGLATLTISAYRHRREKRRRELRPAMTAELFSRLGEDDPDWEAWVAGLSGVERAAARSATERLLRQLRGTERHELGRLAAALGADPERLQREVESNDLHRVLRGLTWLSLVDYPSVVDAAIEHRTGDRVVRTALARVLYESDDPRASREGVDLLLSETDEALSVFGLDTLYRIVRRNPSYLLELGREERDRWNDAVLVQVLLVLRHARSGIGPASIDWVTDCADRDPEIQAELLRLLAGYGWSPRIREGFDPAAFVSHPDPTVRQAAYVALGEWGELDAVTDAVREESDDLARLIGIRVLAEGGRETIDDPSAAYERTRRWVLTARGRTANTRVA